MKTVVTEKKAVEVIRTNMTKAGCTEEHIQSAISNYHELHKEKVVEIAVL